MSDDEAAASSDADDMKRKFREALEKKNAYHRDAAARPDGKGAVTEPHGRAGHKREFRRKSG